MEISIKNDGTPTVLSFDGRVLDIFESSVVSRRYHVKQFASVQLGRPDRHGNQSLDFKQRGPAYIKGVQVAPDEVGPVQELVAAMQQAILAP